MKTATMARVRHLLLPRQRIVALMQICCRRRQLPPNLWDSAARTARKWTTPRKRRKVRKLLLLRRPNRQRRSSFSSSSSSSSSGSAEEQARKKKERRGVHVVLLLHLPRGVDNKFCVSFDLRWRYAFVDSVFGNLASGLPDVEGMINRSMKDVVADLDLKKVLLRCFRPSLSKLVYLHERTNDDVRRQIELLLAYIQDEPFVGLVRRAIYDMLTKAHAEIASAEDALAKLGSGSSSSGEELAEQEARLVKVLDAKRGANWHLTLDVSDAAHEERALELAGTFQATLHAQIMSAVSSTLAIALSHMDRGHGLRLLAEKPRLKALWRGLFQLSFTQMNVFELVNATNNASKQAQQTAQQQQGQQTPQQKRQKSRGEVEVANDSSSAEPFKCRFPFSFFVMKHLEHMRSITEGAPNELALASQFALLGLGSGLEGSLIGWDGGSGGDSSEKDGLDSSSGSAVDDKDDDDDELLRSYVHDFVCMQCPPVDGMSRKAQADFLWHVLSRPQIDRTKPTTNGSRGDEEEEEEEEGGQRVGRQAVRLQ